jgi:two-component system cell cycle sensor histidine kinase/response regulator CckA
MKRNLTTSRQDLQMMPEEECILLKTACELIGEAIMITDRTGKIQYVNPAFERLTGYSLDELRDQNPRSLKSGQHDRPFYENLWNTILSGRVWHGHLINRRKDGALYEEKITISPVENRNGRITHFVAVNRDVTEQTQLQRRLLHAQRMETISALAGGAIHDFNNLLQVILGYSDLFLMETPKGSRLNHALSEIALAARNGAELVDNLLKFRRNVGARFRPANLNDSVEYVHRLLSRSVFKMGEVELSLSPDLALVNADRSQVEHALMNMAINAKDAMTEGEKLVIATRNVSATKADFVSDPNIAPGDYVCVSVSDSGCGIQPDVLPHIFEPYFSTKEAGQRSGLGMFVVHEIVQQHSGYITCTSEPGVGTTLTMYFPVLSSAHDLGHAVCDSALAGGVETILLVDDEPSVREVGRTILQRFGYKVLTACSCAEALDIYSCMKGEIALVILDLIMPDMTGSRCLQELKRMNSKMKVLVTSGCLKDDKQEETKVDAKHFVQKPHQVRTLLQAVRDALNDES